MTKKVTRLGLVDDQALVRKGLRAILDAQPGLRVAFEAEDGATPNLAGGSGAMAHFPSLKRKIGQPSSDAVSRKVTRSRFYQ